MTWTIDMNKIVISPSIFWHNGLINRVSLVAGKGSSAWDQQHSADVPVAAAKGLNYYPV